MTEPTRIVKEYGPPIPASQRVDVFVRLSQLDLTRILVQEVVNRQQAGTTVWNGHVAFHITPSEDNHSISAVVSIWKEEE